MRVGAVSSLILRPVRGVFAPLRSASRPENPRVGGSILSLAILRNSMENQAVGVVVRYVRSESAVRSAIAWSSMDLESGSHSRQSATNAS